MKDTDYYQLRGFPVEDGAVLKVWCPFCKKFHLHGWDKNDQRKRKGVHRVAHCHNPDSPFRNGYYIKAFTKAELKELARG